MLDAWLETTGSLSLAGFHLVACGLLLATAIRLVSPRGLSVASPEPWPGSERLARLLFEYIGNVDRRHHADAAWEGGLADRRTNVGGRELMTWVKTRIGERRLSAQEEQEFLRDVRQLVREDCWLTPDERPRTEMEE